MSACCCTRVNAFVLSMALGLAFAPLAASRAEQVVFYENFGTPDYQPVPANACDPDFPVGWARHNVDARTPNSQVAWMQNYAWVVREDFIHSDITSCVAFSTSYYTPAGAADDWMLTPPITVPTGFPAIRFKAMAPDAMYPDGYEVRWAVADPADVSDASPAFDTSTYLAPMLSNTPLLTVAAEASTWTTHEIDLSALAGQRVRFAFRNNSNDMYLLLLDDVAVVDKVPYDGAITAVLPPHATLMRLPIGQAYPLQLGATIQNQGAQTLTNAVVTAHIKLGGTEIHTVSASAIASLAPDATQVVTMPGYVVNQPGTVTVEYTLAADSEQNAANNALTTPAVEITANELGADDGTAAGTLGIGDPNGGQLGVVYHLAQATNVSAIRFYTAGSTTDLAGNAIVGEIYSTTGSPSTPNTLIAQTLPYIVPTPPVAGFVDLPLAAPLYLAPGDYYFGVVEPVHDTGQTDTLDLGVAMQRFSSNQNWVRFAPSHPAWSPTESFGSQFARALMVRVLLSTSADLSTTLGMPASVSTGATFSAVVSVSNAGPEVADHVVMSLPLPAGVGFVSASGVGWTCSFAASTLTCTRASLAVGAAPAITATLTAPASATTIAATATITTSSVDLDGASATASTLVSSAPPLTFTDPALQATVSGGGASCGFAHAQVLDPSTRPAPPDGVHLLSALFDFRLSGCDSTPVTVTITYPQTLPAQTRYWKFRDSSGTWASFAGAVVSGNTITLTLQDGGAGDDDGVVNGEIVDPGAAAAPNSTPVPSLSAWALLLLASLMAGLALVAQRNRQGTRRS